MAPAGLKELLAALPKDPSWGPPTPTETTLNGVPYAPFSKGDKLGRMADWTSEGKDRERGGNRQQYGRSYRGDDAPSYPLFMPTPAEHFIIDHTGVPVYAAAKKKANNTEHADQQVYGAGTSQLFSIQAAEDESTFSVVDNTRTSTRARPFGRGGATVFRGRGSARGAANNQRGGRGGNLQRVGGRGGGQGADQGRGGGAAGGRGRGGRRFGWKDYDKPQRNRDASVTVRPEWNLLEEIDFARISKLNLDMEEAEDLDSYGFLYSYDRVWDRQPGSKTAERKLNVIERAAYNVTTSSDPIIADLAESDAAAVFTTDNILSMLMCAPRSVYGWDLVFERRGNKLFIDKREGSALDMVTVNENAADAPLELSEGNKDTMNAPQALMLEATHINNVFPLVTVSESPQGRRDMAHEHPFYSPEAETDPPASKAYRYRRFDLSSESSDTPIHLIARTELDAISKNPVSGEPQQLTIHALNEFDNKAAGSGGALDWRNKLASQRGAVVATEMKNNSSKLARWTTQAVLAGADMMKLGFVSRVAPRDANHHVVLGVLGYKPKEFAAQMNLNIGNGWGIVRSMVDIIMQLRKEEKEAQKYVLVKDPNKPLLRLYEVPLETFVDVEEGTGPPEGGLDGKNEAEGQE